MNVVSLSHHRLLRRLSTGALVSLVCNANSPTAEELQIPWAVLKVSNEALYNSIRKSSDCFLVDTSLDWADPFELTRELSLLSPVIWLAARIPRRQKNWVKRAYTAGVSDIFYSPFEFSEISDALRVLLRLKKFG